MRIGILERPAARPDMRAARRPVPDDIENLVWHQPIEPAQGACPRIVTAHLEQRMTGQRRVPDRRHARLAIGLVVVNDQQPVDRAARDRGVRRVAEHVVHQRRIRHCGEDRPETVLAIETLGDEIDGPVDGALAQAFGKELHGRPENGIDAAKEQEPAPALMRRFRRRPDRCRGLDKKLVDADAERIFRARAQRLQHQQRHQNGPRPIGHLGQMERKPARQQHDLDRHFRNAAPVEDAV